VTTLDRGLRKDLENAVRKARRAAEVGARKSLELLAVHHHEPWGTLAPAQRTLRNRLRAHGRQLGDLRDERTGKQAIGRLVSECAYEHWHRMLFARFLAENDLLIEPDSGMPLSLDECRELALERGADWLPLASGFAERMLPQIFRAGDPVLEVSLPPETRQELEEILKALPPAVFAADDSLGWVYQFWQAEQKDAINKDERKIGADELPAVTQLFTEDYMVLFLLHNTLGAWWAGKVLAERPDLAATAASEDELRAACALEGIEWTYLRFVREGSELWRPAAGIFEDWPRVARDLTLLDPCMGSGHFLVFALPILVAFRIAEAGLSSKDALRAVLRDNLFGLEIDPRCTQIAAFNLALAAWRLGGYQALPPLNLACSGLGINARQEEWLRLAGTDTRAQGAMKQLYALFEQAPTLGSLIDPRQIGDDLFVAEFSHVRSLLEQALASERADDTVSEMAVIAQGVLAAARILADRFTLVATNVPYRRVKDLVDSLKVHIEEQFVGASDNLASAFCVRLVDLVRPGGSVAVVSLSTWLFLKSYEAMRRDLLGRLSWNVIVDVGPRAFSTITGEVVDVALIVYSRHDGASRSDRFATLSVRDASTIEAKRRALVAGVEVSRQSQSAQLSNPDARILLDTPVGGALLASIADPYVGLQNGDTPRFVLSFWELPRISDGWEPFQLTPDSGKYFSGLTAVLRWDVGGTRLEDSEGAFRIQGQAAWGKRGVAVSQNDPFPCGIYLGWKFDQSSTVVVPQRAGDLPALFAYVSSSEYREQLRRLDKKRNVTTSTFTKVPFDPLRWQRTAHETFSDGLPSPMSRDATQWLFGGHPDESESPLQVAVARLVGYRWPRQTGSRFLDCPALSPDGLERHAEDEGIVCLMPLRGDAPAADRLGALLADAFGREWSAAKQTQLLSAVDFEGQRLDEWLRNGFFEQHCALFHQQPFVWHVWDGLRNGFGALVNYHRLAASGGDGRRTLEKLAFTYLGDWIKRQRADQAAGVEGADVRVAAAEQLKRELEKILEGEPPYDLFARWKPLHELPIGWEPDINDGVRINIRPFVQAKPLDARGKNACILRVTPKIKWDKDRGKEPERSKRNFPWHWGCDGQAVNFAGSQEFDGNRWNDLHYTRAFKEAARKRAAGATKS
jgi:hypothetical protein